VPPTIPEGDLRIIIRTVLLLPAAHAAGAESTPSAAEMPPAEGRWQNDGSADAAPLLRMPPPPPRRHMPRRRPAAEARRIVLIRPSSLLVWLNSKEVKQVLSTPRYYF